jgi:hypothetical protein
MKGWRIALLAMTLVMAGCSEKRVASAPGATEGERGRPGAMLAYEHSLDIDLDRNVIGQRIKAMRAACVGSTFGACNVLSIGETESGGSLKLRIVPDGVERMADMAGQGGKVSSRETRAEDIGKAVQDTQREREQVDVYSKRLDDLAARKDLSVSDLITLSREQAEVLQKRRALDETAATQQMRLDTNLITFNFRDRSYDGPGALGNLWHTMAEQMKEGIGEALPGAAFCLPFLILAFPVALLWWVLWRWATRRWRRTS